MQTPKKAVLLGIFVLLSINAFSQLSASFNFSSLSRIGVGYQFSGRMWTELRIISNTVDENITPEVILACNVVKKERHNIYAGLGVNINVLGGFTMPIGVEFFPIEAFDRLSLRIELEPTYTAFKNENKLWLMSAFGIKYRFGAKK
jgi:hypothetical protein